MEIIDFERKGNVVRFYLGEKTKDWGYTDPNFVLYNGEKPDWLKPKNKYYGDDWDDPDYSQNAGRVYDEFIKGYKDFAFPFDSLVLEPAYEDGFIAWSKDDLVARKVPCIIVVPKEAVGNDIYNNSFSYWVGSGDKRINKFYFGDEMMPN